MEEWKERTKDCDSGTPTKETHAALHQTTQGLIEIARYCLDEVKLTYVLLGKIQMDCLEDCFGKYRLVSAQYHVLIRQVYECENKLRWQSTLLTLANTEKATNTNTKTSNDRTLTVELTVHGPAAT
ncbi:hypothetical protein HPB48_019804 [Haemaphysalis longicornis]|uniref:Uncharacterized protein n=1 Tax=Haemaphysalis longicornis TaxID=44386 RepID=A0A9J6GC06_HAELO|nr:hypothetical protein HPB48_019804 [Haemaphysalis longicornis]